MDFFMTMVDERVDRDSTLRKVSALIDSNPHRPVAGRVCQECRREESDASELGTTPTLPRKPCPGLARADRQGPEDCSAHSDG